jgi:Flp pilus assembly protein TadG
MRDTRRRVGGSVLIEAALTLPFLILLIMGIFEFGRILMIQQALTNAAREGARVAALDIDDVTSIASAQAITTNYLTASGIDLALVSVNPTFIVVNGSQAIRVAISYNYSSSLNSFIPAISPSLQLNSQVIMRREA